MKIKILFLLIISLTIVSCKNKIQLNINNFTFEELISKCDKINIKLYDSTVEKQLSRGAELLIPKKVYVVVEKQIQDFKNIIENSESTDYCCCPISTYSISFLKSNKELEIFYVDTVGIKNKIRIYESGYQYSYIIEKQKWKDFLYRIEK